MADNALCGRWPELPYAGLAPTLETLQLWTQIVGKLRLSKTPWLNHSWHVALYVSARGLTTSLITDGGLGFDLEFDFISDVLAIRASDGGSGQIALKPGSVADFYAELTRALACLGIACSIDIHPNEIPEPTPFPKDVTFRPMILSARASSGAH